MTAIRKSPRQERSRVLVEAIVEAAASIVVRQGRHALTTNAVAVRAGVSIGSLYQYFPNREAVLAALAWQHLDRVYRHIAAVDVRSCSTLAEATRRIVSGVFDAHYIDPALHLALASEVAVAKLGLASPVHPETTIVVIDLFKTLPSSLAQEVRHPDLNSALIIVAEITHALAHAAIAQPDAIATRIHLENEAVRAILAYLSSSSFELTR